MECKADSFSLGKFLVEKNNIKTDPIYQRKGSLWGVAKKQLFIDSVINGYDVPKIYLHRLGKDDEDYGRYEYTIVDGKQRLETVWDFFDNKFSLADDFEYKRNIMSAVEKAYGTPEKTFAFKDFNEHWKEKFKSEQFSVVVIEDADEQDIEDLFSRLNNAEPLNAAEKRNAFGGDMNRLIRDIADGHKFFKETIPLKDKRYIHRDITARFLLIEKRVVWDSDDPYCDLKKKFLDDLVKKNKSIEGKDKKKLKEAVDDQLNSLVRVFEQKDALLRKSGYSQLYYLFLKEEEKTYVCEVKSIKKFLIDFNLEREASLDTRPEDKEGHNRYLFLDQFERLTREGNDKNSLKDRVMILLKFLLQDYPSIELKDIRRNFTDAEKYAIFIQSGGKCANCGKIFKNFSDFEADHVIAWAKGGKTTIANAQALCKSCNRSKGAR